MKRLSLFVIIFLLLSANSVLATPDILIDKVHGVPTVFSYFEDDYGLEFVLPDCNFHYLTADDFPIENVLADGVLTEADTLIVAVAAEAEMLYGRFSFEDENQPGVDVYGPDGEFIVRQVFGSFHIENPAPGDYTIIYISWNPNQTTTYEIGTGPQFFTLETLQPYDIVCRMLDCSMWFFMGGGVVPDYSPADETVLDDYFNYEGNFLFLIEPMDPSIDKPIIRLYSPQDISVDIEVNLPGIPTFAQPRCQTRPVPGGTIFDWEQIEVAADEPVEILYEGKLIEPLQWVQFSIQPELAIAQNIAGHAIEDVHLFRYNSRYDIEVVPVGHIETGTQQSGRETMHLSRSEAIDYLKQVIHEGGLSQGLYPQEMTEFQQRCRWIERWLDNASLSGTWQALYQFSTEAYDALIPLECNPSPQEIVRTMWVFVTDIPEGLPLSPGQFQDLPGLRNLPSLTDDPPLIYHEYGVINQSYPVENQSAGRDLSYFGWTFYEESLIVDPTDNTNGDFAPIFQTWGDHPDVNILSENVGQVSSLYASVIDAPASEQILTGDEDAWAYTPGFPVGSFPPVVVGKAIGSGQVIAIHDLHLAIDELDNVQFFNNIVTWMTDETVVEVESETTSGQIWLAQNFPNPFNPVTTIQFNLPRQTEVSLKIFNPAGQEIETLLSDRLEAGPHTAEWQANRLSSGVYLYRLEVGNYVITKKLVLLK